MISNSRTIDRHNRAPGRARNFQRSKSWIAFPGTLFVVVAATLTLFAAHAAARDWPKPTAHVNDLANALDSASRDSMEVLAREVREKTGSQIAVLVVPDLGGEDVDAAAEEVYRQWGVGRKGKDDGVLILLTVSERRVRIEVGYGLEGILPDGRAGSIIRNVMGPDLRQNRFGPGLLRGVEAVAQIIADDAGVALSRKIASETPPRSSPAGALGPILLFVFLLIFVSAIASRRRRTRGWGDWRTRRRRGWYDPWGGFGGGLGGLGGFGGFGGGGGLGGGGGGGFGGFGGGRSGGGGASGGF